MPSDIQTKLLIVDDLPENLLALEALIKRQDLIVYKALSADEALSLLLQHEFALAILDVQIAGMNGFELAELMRGTEKPKASRLCSSVPLAVISTTHSRATKAEPWIFCTSRWMFTRSRARSMSSSICIARARR